MFDFEDLFEVKDTLKKKGNYHDRDNLLVLGMEARP